MFDGAKGGLLDLGEEVLRVLVEGEVPHRDQRVVLLRPGLRQVEGVPAVPLGIVERHDLHLDVPGGVVAALDGLVKVGAGVVEVAGPDELPGVLVGEVVPALAGLEVVLHPEALTGGVDPLVDVRAEAVHVTGIGRDAAVTHGIGDLVGGLRAAGPEVPLHVRAAQAVGQTLLRADEIGELHAVTQEEHRGVVTDEVVVALAGVEFQREATDVPDRVGEALLTGDGRKRASIGVTRPGWNRSAFV